MTTELLSIKALQAMVDRCPFNRWMGLRMMRVDEEGIALTASWREEFMSSPERCSTHGGILASIVDAAGVYAIAARVHKPVPTIDMQVDYHRIATPGDLVARAHVLHLGGTLGSSQTQIFDAGDRLIATGRAVYFIGSRTNESERGGERVGTS